MYLLTHSLVLVLVAVMKPKVLKTKISHADPPTLSLFVWCVLAALLPLWLVVRAAESLAHRSLSRSVSCVVLCSLRTVSVINADGQRVHV